MTRCSLSEWQVLSEAFIIVPVGDVVGSAGVVVGSSPHTVMKRFLAIPVPWSVILIELIGTCGRSSKITKL